MTRPEAEYLWLLDKAIDLGAPCQGEYAGWWTSEDWYEAMNAARMCRKDCPVVAACRMYADRTHQKGGVWGGRTQYERRLIQRGKIAG